MNQITTIAIDVGKRTFQVGGENARGEEQWQERFTTREEFVRFLATLQPPLHVVMEVGLGAQAWARELQSRGLRVSLLPAAAVAKHRSGPKNDRNDVRAILRAARDVSIHPVPIKSAEQLAMQALHRARAGWIRRRTALANQMRGLLTEHAMVFAQGERALRRGLESVLADPSVPIPARLLDLLQLLRAEWEHLAEQLNTMDAELIRLARADPVARRVDTIRGIGPIGASALACKGLDPTRYANGRQFSASFGIVPDQHSSSDRYRLGRMSRRGDRYVRSLLICGAHAVIRALPRRTQDDSQETRRLRRWVARCGAKGAAIRLANHNLREVYALLTHNEDHHMI